jgi:glycosyltransferase involved in cell wall biosynthesis
MPDTVLQVNKFHHPRAGAETVYLQTRELLSEHGHRVLDFAMDHPANIASPYSDTFGPQRNYGDGDAGRVQKVLDAVASIYSPASRRALGRLLDRQQPDVAHLHNVYHQLTLSVVDELDARGIPIVLTLHDWKVACPAYTLFTEGAPCRRCPTGGLHNAIRHRCVKGSVAASALAAAEAELARRRGTYLKVDRFIAPSGFAAEVAVLGGIPRDRVAVVENFLTEDELGRWPGPRPSEPTLLYAGRLDATKGIRQMLAAFRNVRGDGVRLRIAGAGDLEDEVRASAAADARIDFAGRLPRETLFEEFARARALLLPSVWEDNCPLVLLESQAMGLATVVSGRGGPPEFVRDGVDGRVIDPEDVVALTATMQEVLDDGARSDQWGQAARLRVAERNNAANHYAQLMDVYSRAKSRRAQ